MYVALDAAVKFMVLKIRNDSSRHRRLSATGYIAWVLGDLPVKNAMYVVTELAGSGALLAQNHYNTEFGERTAFFDASTSNLELNTRSITGDRTEFLGRNGTLAEPAALKRSRLSGRLGAGLDPCGAIQLAFDLPSDHSREVIFTVGAGQNKQQADALAVRYRGALAAELALTAVRQFWQQTINVQVKSPDPALNLLANGWLLYQVLSCRIWGRSGYYQSGGAFGFRDQLQDVMALTYVAPQLLRAHILLCAAHQFEAGDVQHWWHPPSNRGVRTRCSDDYLWLPFVICHYIERTGDMGILDETIPFLQGRLLNPGEESYYEVPAVSNEAICLYQHAVRAINQGLKFGKHGLPLMGSGDWNDGMNLVGKEGNGESVWLGFFLYDVLKHFASLALRYGDNEFATHCEAESSKLQQQIETHAWDGEWYRRAYFDDGTPLGSATNHECRIDSIAQSWSVLSAAADPMRAKQSMTALYNHLVNTEGNLIKLLDPPFDKSKPSPGYIQGYVPGIRENGGQYTHAAVWAAMAFAKLNEKQLAWELFHMLNPINHGRSAAEIERYKIEPYVVAADIYSVVPHVGRGGWSWYTGSAGWLYRLIIEVLLGIKLIDGKKLSVSPLLPDEWDGFSVDYHHGNTLYQIKISRVTDQAGILLDGTLLAETYIPLEEDGKTHQVQVNIPIAFEI
jgi:cyclic beta-1,2-glucan synthetase